MAVRLATDFLALWKDLPAAVEIYGNILHGLKQLPLDRYNEGINNSVKKLVESIEELNKTSRKKLVHETKKPRPLRLYEPVIEDQYVFLVIVIGCLFILNNLRVTHFSYYHSFEGRKKRVGSKEKLEREKLQHKLKREMKGAIREIRKDNAFIGRIKIKEQIER